MSKRIVLCADGTWNTPHGPAEMPNDTNVRKMFLLLNDDDSQLKYYDSGVGTDGTPFEHFFGGTMGDGLFQKVQDGYAFLAYVWDPGDEIYLFGFSRGAYTARSLGGMIAGFGVPTKNLDNQTVLSIFNAYRTTGPATRAAMKAQLTEQYALTDVTIRMVGVWDTVGALGIPGQLFSDFDQAKYGFLDTTLSAKVQNAYHAISLDERRAPFQPTLWTNPDGSARANDAQVTQVWFPGVHCDVGGSYAEEQLSNITLNWMIGNAKACGLTFDETALAAELGAAPFDPLGMVHESWQVVPWGLPKNRVALRQTTKFPYDERITLTVDKAPTAPTALQIRVPYWATKGFAVAINGQQQQVSATPSSYVRVEHDWKAGDAITVDVPLPLHINTTPDDKTVQAAMYGPLVLAVLLGTDGLTTSMIYGDSGPRGYDDGYPMPTIDQRPRMHRDEGGNLVPVPSVDTSGIWFEQAEPSRDYQLRFQTKGRGPTHTLVPLNQIMDERYSVYLRTVQS